MKHLPLSATKLTKILRSSSLQKKAIYQNFGIKGFGAQEEILFRLLMMTFIARQIGWKVSLVVSGRVL